jgi:hypothetical protein
MFIFSYAYLTKEGKLLIIWLSKVGIPSSGGGQKKFKV